MRVSVRVFGSLMPIVGELLTIELEEGAKIGLLKRMIFERADLRALREREELVGEGGRLLILLNGRNVETLEGDETELRDGDLVILISPFAGG
jgi:molybdopterin synthase sulfur carrier subunit